MNSLRIAIYGDVNLNVIDGSSIWVSNVTKLCAAADNTDIVVYSKAPLHQTTIVQPLLQLSNVHISHPRGDRDTQVLSLQQIVARVSEDDTLNPFDGIIVRGLAAAEAFATSSLLAGKLWLYLTDIPQASALADETIRSRLQALTEKCRYVLCQTEELRNFLETRCQVSGRKLLLQPPVVADTAFREDLVKYSPDSDSLRLIYSGKFAPLWGLEEQLDALEAIRRSGISAEFHIVGDKFHNDPRNAAFGVDLKERFQQTPGVRWHGGLTQEGVFWLQEKCHVGMALRAPEMNNSLELSTKLLEYGASGIAAIVNPTLMHRRALGDDYPLFANSSKEAAERLSDIVSNPGILELAANRLRKLAERHRSSHFQPLWNRYLGRMGHLQPPGTVERKKKVVLAGHDLKFCKELIEYLRSRKDVELRIDKWASLREHDEVHSHNLLKWADIVICEWCAGNAVWYSHNIDSSKQRLFVRFHRFEANSEFPAKVDMNRTEKVIFVGQHILDDAAERFQWPRDRLAVIPNFVDTLVYDRPKLPQAQFNLGLIGYVPMLKRLDRAVDIMEHLLEKDDRYFLFVKGKHPWNYPWIWRNEKERNHYEAVFERIRTNDRLKDHIVFDGFGDDIPSWLRKIGFVLSVSDLESFHMAAAEGMASGADTVLWEREGVEAIFPGKPVFKSASQAADFILEQQDLREANKRFVAERYSYEVVSNMLDDLLHG